MTSWAIRRSRWGWSLYWRGELVASADNPLDLVGLVGHIGEHAAA